MFNKNERLALFIDGPNLYSSAKGLGFEIDFKPLLEVFTSRGNLLRAYYFTAVPDGTDSEGRQPYAPIRPLLDWLSYNGYKVVSKPTKEFRDETGNVKVKGNMDIELCVTALELAFQDLIDHAVIFSGDGDFTALVESLQRQGVKVSVVSTIKTRPSMIADELRRSADIFIELDELKEEISKKQSEEPVG
jgi:uncharacterized LabA/DUF88 family protein